MLDLLVADSSACIDVPKTAPHAKPIAMYANRIECRLVVMEDNSNRSPSFIRPAYFYLPKIWPWRIEPVWLAQEAEGASGLILLQTYTRVAPCVQCWGRFLLVDCDL
jgi:hypothetical protein